MAGLKAGSESWNVLSSTLKARGTPTSCLAKLSAIVLIHGEQADKVLSGLEAPACRVNGVSPDLSVIPPSLM